MPVFMRRHYEVLAAVLRSSYDNAANRQQTDGIQLLQRVLTATLRADNERFDEQKFIDGIQGRTPSPEAMRDLQDDWVGSGARRRGLTFTAYVREMAANPSGTLQNAAREVLQASK